MTSCSCRQNDRNDPTQMTQMTQMTGWQTIDHMVFYCTKKTYKIGHLYSRRLIGIQFVSCFLHSSVPFTDIDKKNKYLKERKKHVNVEQIDQKYKIILN